MYNFIRCLKHDMIYENECTECAKEELGHGARAVFLDGEYAEPSTKALDKQEGGQHYKNYKIQPIEYIVENNLGYREGNVIKYVTRHKDKNGAEDIKKAIHYLEMILEDYSNENY